MLSACNFLCCHPVGASQQQKKKNTQQTRTQCAAFFFLFAQMFTRFTSVALFEPFLSYFSKMNCVRVAEAITLAQRPLIVNLYIRSKFTLQSIQQLRVGGIHAFRIKRESLTASTPQKICARNVFRTPIILHCF